MSKYIDADEFVKDLDRLCDIVCQYSKKQRGVMCGACPLGDAFELLDNQPAVDVVAVVRCGECANRYTTCPMALRMPTGGAPFVSFIARDDDYCSYGERKDG